MNLALSLFHFNPHWGANERSANRHRTETLGPFLHALHSNPRWRVDIEISGSGLEFLQSGYPEQIRLLRELVHRGQVELISALYTPNIWIAFPRRDLEMSIELKRRCLEKLGFPWSRIFFAQEAFFGEVVQALTEHFDIAVCKDDYLSYSYRVDLRHPCFRVGNMRVIVASGHILKEIAFRHTTDAHFDQQDLVPHWHDPQ